MTGEYQDVAKHVLCRYDWPITWPVLPGPKHRKKTTTLYAMERQTQQVAGIGGVKPPLKREI